MQQPSSVKRGRPRGFHSSMPRSNPHARERVMDDGKHLDAFARSYPSRDAKRRSCLRLVGRVGALSILLRTQSVTKRCSRKCRVGALLLLRGAKNSSTRCSRPVPTMEAIRKDGESRHPHGSLSRPPVAIRSSGTGATANLPVVLLGGESHLGPATIRRRGSGPCACTACRRQRGTDLSNGSCSRSYRSGRSRTNGGVLVDARSNGKPERRAEAKRGEGQLSTRE
jgi:hypothetical protein